jgi:hypothetical protein|tara:strand:+ start:37 stop:261 length:225 start_codon:yes stop_codon:yes gene_type:complete
MALINQLLNQGSIYSNLNGAPGPQPNLAGSKLHNEYSLNGKPKVKNKPAPSILDLNGQTPTDNYRNTAPEGRTF